jgi:hypothetical protein
MTNSNKTKINVAYIIDPKVFVDEKEDKYAIK